MAIVNNPESGDTPREGWVLYDGHCGFCSRWVPHWAPTLRRRGFDIATLGSDWVVESLQLTPEQQHTDIRLLLADGRQLLGADVYRYVMRRVWWAIPFYLIATTPGFRQIFDAAYRAFADNRYWISRTCHMPVKPESRAGISQ
jgi:predicted DCC family thiol-disulfide oxidoreductase YuxK